MTKFYQSIIVLSIALLFITACEAAPTPTAVPTEVAATDLPPTITATAIRPSPTAPLATATVPATVEIETETDNNQENTTISEDNLMNINIGDRVLTATLAANSSAAALKEALAEGPITINMRDYDRMEKVGPLGMNLPRNDEPITTEAGDIILFQGSAFVIYYAPNSWNFTRLGKIDNVTAAELREILGAGNVTVTLSLP